MNLNEGKAKTLTRSLCISILVVLAAIGAACSQSEPTPTASPEPTQPAPGPTSVIRPATTPAISPTAAVSPTPASSTGTRIAQDGDSVTVHYRGTLDGGEVFDSSRDREPLTFELGSGQLITGFDNAVRGMAVGDTVTVRLEPDEAYGEHSDELILEFPRSSAPDDIAVGNTVRLANGLPAVITEVTDEIVRLDANHPLAGKALTFEIEIIAIQ